MAYRKNAQGRKKPCVIAARLSQQDYAKFDDLTKRPGKKQEVIEKFILDFIKDKTQEAPQ